MKISLWRTLAATLLVISGALLPWTTASSTQVPDSVFLAPAAGRQTIDEKLEYLEDPEGTYGIEQVAHEKSSSFKPLTRQKPLGYAYRGKVFWVRFTIDSAAYGKPSWFLTYDYEHIANLKIFYPTDTGLRVKEMDEDLPDEGRDIVSRDYIVELPTQHGGPAVYYARFAPEHRNFRVNFSWSSSKGMIESTLYTELGYGLFFGALAVLWLYNAALFLYLRDRAYLYYIYYLACFIATFFHIYGVSHLFMRLTPFREQLFAMAAYGTIHGLVIFARHFLSLKESARRIDAYLKTFQWILVVSAFAVFLEPVGTPFKILNYIILATVPVAIYAGIVRWRAGYGPARLYSAGWLLFGASLIALSARSLNWLPMVDDLTVFMVPIASVWEAVLFSLALGYRIKLTDAKAIRLVQDKEKALDAEQAALGTATQAINDKNTFLSMISHELRTPLQSILSGIDMLERRNIGEDNEEYLKRIRWGSNALTRQLSDLLTLSQGQTGRLEMRPELFEAVEFVRGAIDRVRPAADKKALQLLLSTEEEASFVIADATRLNQVLQNLLDNAVKYTKSGFIAVKLSSKRSGMLTLSVQDSGVGIAPELMPSLRKPFSRVGEVDRERSGSGIGLAVVDVVLGYLGGTLTIDSETGVGSLFEVTIPVSYPEEQESPSALPRPKRMLIVDDRDDVLESLCAVAGELGIDCETANSSAVAANMMATKVFDIVLLDIEMPIKNGYELASETRRGRGRNSETVMVAMSASMRSEKDWLWAFDAFFLKPISREQLWHLLDIRRPASGPGGPARAKAEETGAAP